MAFDAFLKIDGIKGESNDSKHKDEIEIESFSWGATQTGTFAGGGGAGAGKVQFQDIHFTTNVSKASPQLFLRCATGEHLKLATITLRKSSEGGSGVEFYKLTLSDVLVSSYQSGGSSGSSVPVDQFSLNFTKVEYAYTQQDATGKPGDTSSAGWDLKLNKKT